MMGRPKKLTVYSRVVGAEKELWRSDSGRINENQQYEFKTAPLKYWKTGNAWEAIAEWKGTVQVLKYQYLKTAPTDNKLKAGEEDV